MQSVFRQAASGALDQQIIIGNRACAGGRLVMAFSTMAITRHSKWANVIR